MSIGVALETETTLTAAPRPTPVGRRLGRRALAKLGADGLAFTVAIAAAYLLRFDGVPPGGYAAQAVVLVFALPLLRLGVGWYLGTHRTSWRLFGLSEALTTMRAIAWVSGILLAARLALPVALPGVAVVPVGVIVLDGLGALAATLAMRVIVRVVDEHRTATQRRAEASRALRRVVLVGAGRAGRMAARELRQRPDAGFDPVAFVDDDPTRLGQVIEGLAVMGTTGQASRIAHQCGADDLILTMPSAPRTKVRAIVERCRAEGLSVKTVPGLFELIAGRVGITRIRPVRIEDLLGRDVVRPDDVAIGRVRAAFTARRIVVTGAGGSIGSELCRQLARLRPERLVLLEANENNLFDIEQEMRAALGDRAIACLADVRDAEQVELALAAHRPHVIFHAAAYKHVPMMERHPSASIANNVGGTRVLVDAARAIGVERFLLVSTDKAVNPTSIMGASKRVAELVVNSRGHGMRCCAVRFGNVLGSRGSVLHTFRQQIERGGPVTVTHPDVTRFFMTIPEAVRLILDAAAMGRGGETFLLDMGEAVKILDMARQMIRLAGLSEQEVPVDIVGLRPGEKLHEELLHRGEKAAPTDAEGILLAARGEACPPGTRERIAALEHAADVRDEAALRRILAELTGYTEPDAKPHHAATG